MDDPIDLPPTPPPFMGDCLNCGRPQPLVDGTAAFLTGYYCTRCGDYHTLPHWNAPASALWGHYLQRCGVDPALLAALPPPPHTYPLTADETAALVRYAARHQLPFAPLDSNA